MNKRILGIACACLLSCQALQAQEVEQPLLPQELPNEVYVGYGVLSLPVVVNGLGDILLGTFFGGGGDRKIVVGPVMAGYTRLLSKRIGVGIEAGYTSYTSKDRSTGELDFRNTFVVVMPHGELYWARLRGVDFYSGLKAGACYISREGGSPEDDNALTAAFHFTAVGVRIGKKLGFYTDYGFGFDGTINAGLSLRF